MKTSEKIKKMIIENWILFYEHREPTPKEIELIQSYIEEDHVNEIVDCANLHEDDLGLFCICQNCGSSTNV